VSVSAVTRAIRGDSAESEVHGRFQSEQRSRPLKATRWDAGECPPPTPQPHQRGAAQAGGQLNTRQRLGQPSPLQRGPDAVFPERRASTRVRGARHPPPAEAVCEGGPLASANTDIGSPIRGRNAAGLRPLLFPPPLAAKLKHVRGIARGGRLVTALGPAASAVLQAVQTQSEARKQRSGPRQAVQRTC